MKRYRQENKLFKENGWIEFCVYPLFSPHSVISEGTAEYATHLVFPTKEKVEYEKEVLFPIAGFDPSEADLCNQVYDLITRLRPIRIEVPRDYLDNKIHTQEAIDRLI